MLYRDNFFVALAGVQDCDIHLAAQQFSDMLSMPVKLVGCKSRARCLEVHLSLRGDVPRCVLAFRTDPDRQGESGDVRSWPEADDPRTPMILPGLLMGLASKLRFYSGDGIGGYTGTIRRMCGFVKAKGYPGKWWVKPLAQALLRVGAVLPCLPPLLRQALGCPARPRYRGLQSMRQLSEIAVGEDVTFGRKGPADEDQGP